MDFKDISIVPKNQDKIYFFNKFHNGDVFYSKEFVKDIKNKIGKRHYYIHNNDNSILKDVDIKQVDGDIPELNSKIVSEKNGDVYINTWINKYYSIHNCSLKGNYLLYTEIYEKLGINIEPMSYYIPNVDFTKVDTVNINNYFNNKANKTVLICNNNVRPGQSINFDFDPIIDYLSNKYENIVFIITNDTSIVKKNIVNAKDIIGYNMANLLEMSYLSTFVDVIIGRASGPFCFSHIRKNMMDKNKTFISFTHKENNSKWIPDNMSLAKQFWFDKYEYEYIIEKIIKIL